MFILLKNGDWEVKKKLFALLLTIGLSQTTSAHSLGMGMLLDSNSKREIGLKSSILLGEKFSIVPNLGMNKESKNPSYGISFEKAILIDYFGGLNLKARTGFNLRKIEKKETIQDSQVVYNKSALMPYPETIITEREEVTQENIVTQKIEIALEKSFGKQFYELTFFGEKYGNSIPTGLSFYTGINF